MYTTAEKWGDWARDRGLSGPTSTPSDAHKQALQRADDYIRMHYVTYFGSAVVVSEGAVATALSEAVHIAASLEVDTPGLFSKTYTPQEQSTLVKLEGLSWEPVKASPGLSASDIATPRSVAIEALLAPYRTPLVGPFIV